MTRRQHLCGKSTWRRAWRVVVLAGLAAGASPAVAGPSPAVQVTFDRYEFVAGKQRETLLTGSFLGAPAADVALVGVDERGTKRLRIFAFSDGAWREAVVATLQPGTLFVDAFAAYTPSGAKIERLLTYQRGQFHWFDPETRAQQPLAALEARYQGGDGIPHIDVAEDRNGDGLGDLLIPDTDGFWVATQTPNGAFAEPVKIGPPEPYLAATALGEPHTYGTAGITPTNFPWYLSRVHQADYNQDGRQDLVFWNEDRFDVHLQDERGQFRRTAEAHRARAPFDADGTYSLMFEYNDENTLRLLLGLRKKTQITMLHTLRDMNGDGIADLTTLSLEGRSLANHRGEYRLHFGRVSGAPDDATIDFPAEPDATIRPRGKAGALQASGYSSLWMRDFDGDGDVDVLFRDVVMGIGGMVRAMAGKSIALDVELYRMEAGGFPRRPDARRRVRPRLYPIGAGVFFPPVLIGDLHGDGRFDLVVGKGRNELRLYAGVDARDAFARQPQKVSVTLPDDERNTRLVDLNGDGKQDILVYNTQVKPHLVTTLIAR